MPSASTGSGNRRLRVVTLVDLPVARGGGGAELLSILTTARLDPDRFDRTLCATRSIDEPHPVIADSGTRLLVLGRRSPLSLASWRPLISVIRRERVDVIHAHKFGSNVWASVIGRWTGVPVVIAHEHTWAYEGDLRRKLLDRHLIGRLATTVVAVSRADRDRMISYERLPPEKVVFVPNGIPPLRPPTGIDARAEFGIPAAAPLVTAVAVLRAQKTLDVLVRAAAALRPRLPDARFLIVGQGPERGRLERLVAELDLREVVIFAGDRSDVPDLVRACDVAALSSAYEGSPLAIMEYMAAAKPVVATRVGGVPDLIEDGVHGLLVEPGQPGLLADALYRLLTSPTLRATMGAAGAERQRREFDIDVMVGHLEDLYEELYARTARARAEGWSRRTPTG